MKYFPDTLNKIYLSFLCILVLNSCKFGIHIPKSEFSNLIVGEKVTFQNKAKKTTERISSTFLEKFPYFKDTLNNVKEIRILVVTKNEIMISFIQNGYEKEYRINGELVSNKYFEIYFIKEKLQIPPYFPIIRGNNSIDRLRIGKLINGEIIVDHFQDYTGNIFILAAGYRLRDYCIYDIINIGN